jgi:hypothetical protein
MPEEVRPQYEYAVTKPLDTVLSPEQTFETREHNARAAVPCSAGRERRGGQRQRSGCVKSFALRSLRAARLRTL